MIAQKGAAQKVAWQETIHMAEAVLRAMVMDFKREALRKGFRLTFSGK